ncbi:MAG: sulfite exporter TauE/SafE family protein [Planctomycetales bacterium]|nr:sulfite exporter TauE/SafE family protein [Planctomycetales bacterium]
MELAFLLPAALVGALVGLVVGLTSMGGGALLTPALVLGLGVPPSVAVGSDVLIASVLKLFGGGAYALRRQVHWGTALRLAAGSVPGALLGVTLLNRLPPGTLDRVLGRAVGAVLVLAGAATIARLALRGRSAPQAFPSTARTVALGLATGLLVGTTSIGSGSLLVLVLATLFPLDARTVVGTDLVHALLLSAAATAGHFAAGRVDPALAAAVLAGGVPGVLAGSRLAIAVPERGLRGALALALVATGGHLLAFGSPGGGRG